MPNPCEDINEVGDLSDAMLPTIGPQPPATGAPRIVEALVLAFAVIAGSTGDMSEATTTNSSARVSESGTITDQVQHTARFEVLAGDGGSITDGHRLYFSATGASSGDFSDAAVLPAPGAVLADAGALADAAYPATTARVTVSEIADGADAVTSAKSVVLAVSGDFSDAALPASLRAETVQEAGALVSAALLSADTSATLADSARIADAALPRIVGLALVQEEASIEDAAVFDGATGAWTATTDNFAMSRWADLPELESLAEIDGKLYAAGPDGLYCIDGDTDDGADVQARLTGGLSDMGPMLQHASYLYCGYTCDGSMLFSVGHTSAGVEQSVSYAMPARRATDPVSNRVKVGRGMRSRYWRFSFENVNGSDFEVFDRRALTDTTARRI